MQNASIDTASLSALYFSSDEGAREQLFAHFFSNHYDGPHASSEALAKNLTALITALDLLPPVDPVGNPKSDDLSSALQEAYGGMYKFCLSTPPGIDFAWNATMSFISQLGNMTLRGEQVDAKAAAISELKWWISEYASGDACDVSDDGELAQESDITVLAITQQNLQRHFTDQLSKLALNRKARKDHIVNRIIAGRALRDGYATGSPTRNLYAGAFELRFIEVALLRKRGQPLFDGSYQSSADVIAATFLLRSCAKSLLRSFPSEGAEFDEPMQLAPLKAGQEGRDERLQGWKNALETFVVGSEDQSNPSSFAVANYAALALENLQDPRDESIEELFTWDKVVF